MANFSQDREIDLLMEEKELDQQHIKELEKKIQELSDTNKQLTETNDQLAQTMDRKSVQMTKIARHNSQLVARSITSVEKQIKGKYPMRAHFSLKTQPVKKSSAALCIPEEV